MSLLQPHAKKSLALGAFLLAVAVLIGAFGAHGLKNLVSPEKLVTFETGVRYHFYHAFGILLVGLLQQQLAELKLRGVASLFFVGILLFSFNCYFYVLSGIKVFAMIVPLGGLSFAAAWILLGFKILKAR
jgi:uncharacterized membrane protein YgdD (TMEM256/DUF423 family)